MTGIVNAHVHNLNGGNLGSQQLIEGQLLDFLLGSSSGLGSSLGSGGLGGSLVFLVLHVLGQLNSFQRTDNHVPAGQLLSNFALHHGNLAGDDQGAVLNLVLDVQRLEGLLDGAGGELTGSPGSQNGHTGSVGDNQVDGLVGALQFAGNQEVGQGEVNGQRAGAVFVSAVQGVNLGLHLHGFLGVGVDVLTQAVQRQGCGVVHLLHNNDGSIALGEHGGVGNLQLLVALCQFRQIPDGGIAEAAVAVHQSGTTHLDSV